MQTTEGTTKRTMTDAEATDEAMLLFTRKMRRLHTRAFDDVWARLPEGAKRAIYAAERRADVLRDQTAGGADGLAYSTDDDPEDDES